MEAPTPPAPGACPGFDAMIQPIETQNGVVTIRGGATLEKLLASDDPMCKAYGDSIVAYKAWVIEERARIAAEEAAALAEAAE